MTAIGGRCDEIDYRDYTLTHSDTIENQLENFLASLFLGGVVKLGENFEGSNGRVYKGIFPRGDDASISLQSRYLQDRISSLEGRIFELGSRKPEAVAVKLLKSRERRIRSADLNKGSHYVMGQSHPNIASVYAAIVYNQEDGHIYLEDEVEGVGGDEVVLGCIQKWVEGKDLYAWDSDLYSKDQSLTADQIRIIIRDVTLGLEHLEERGIGHRDLSLANILLDSLKGRALLTDFDYAGRFERGKNGSFFAGTLGCMAPEVLFKHQHQSKSDYFSLGSIIGELVFGRSFFPNDESIDNAVQLRCESGNVTDLDEKCHIKRELWREIYILFLTKPRSSRINIVRLNDDGSFKVRYLSKRDILSSVSEDPQVRAELFDLIKSLLLRTPEIRRSGKRVLQHDFMKRDVKREMVPEVKMLLAGTGIARPPVCS